MNLFNKLLVVYLIFHTHVTFSKSKNPKTSGKTKGCVLSKSNKITQLSEDISSYLAENPYSSIELNKQIMSGCKCKKGIKPCEKRSKYCSEYIDKHLQCYLKKKQNCGYKRELKKLGISKSIDYCSQKKKKCSKFDCVIYGLFTKCFGKSSTAKCIVTRISNKEPRSVKKKNMITAVTQAVCEFTKGCKLPRKTKKQKPSQKKKKTSTKQNKGTSENFNLPHGPMKMGPHQKYARYSDDGCYDYIATKDDDPYEQTISFVFRNSLDDHSIKITQENLVKQCMNSGDFATEPTIGMHKLLSEFFKNGTAAAGGSKIVNSTEWDVYYHKSYMDIDDDFNNNFYHRKIRFKLTVEGMENAEFTLEYRTWFYEMAKEATCTMTTVRRDYDTCPIEILSSVHSCNKNGINEVDVVVIMSANQSFSFLGENVEDIGTATRIRIQNTGVHPLGVQLAYADCFMPGSIQRTESYIGPGASEKVPAEVTFSARTKCKDYDKASTLYFYIYERDPHVPKEKNGWAILTVDVRYQGSHDITARTCSITSAVANYGKWWMLKAATEIKHCTGATKNHDYYNIRVFVLRR